MTFKDLKRILFNLIRFKHPNLIEIREYAQYDFDGVAFNTILSFVKTLKYHRTYFMERKLKKEEIWYDWNNDRIDQCLTWIQRIKSNSSYFLIYDEKRYRAWTRIGEEDLANFLKESESILIERTGMDHIKEGSSEFGYF